MLRNQWTEEEITFLKNNHLYMSDKNLADSLNKGTDSIQEKKKQLNLLGSCNPETLNYIESINKLFVELYNKKDLNAQQKIEFKRLQNIITNFNIKRQKIKKVGQNKRTLILKWDGRCIYCKAINISETNIKKNYYICTDCSKQKSKEHYIQNKQVFKYRAEQRYKKLKSENNLEFFARSMISSHKYRDKIKNKETICDFTYVEYLDFINNPCNYCGTTDERRGLDRIDNNLGHSKNNVVPCCKICNQVRNDYFTVAEMKQLGNLIKIIKEKRGA